MLPQHTREEIALSRERTMNGKDTKVDKLLLHMADGLWHTGLDLANSVSWRFGAYLYDLREKRGVRWEKERILGTKDRVFRYRLEGMDDNDVAG